MTSRVKVLFIAGSGRSGSTILHNVLGQVPGFTAVGELRYIWGRAALRNLMCGCGRRFDECELWTEVMGLAFGGVDRGLAEEMLELTESFRIRDLPRTWVPSERRRQLARLAPYLERLGRLYTTVRDVSGARVVVDSSKNPSYGYLLGHVEAVDVRYLHFVRDSPPVANSWGKQKEFEPGVPMATKGPVRSALQWDARNVAAELFLPPEGPRRMRIRYEDLMARPRERVTDVVRWSGEPIRDLPFTSEHVALLRRPNHSVFGNSVRFTTGPVELRQDDRWRSELPTRHRLEVAALTLPLRARYGYLTPTGGAPAAIERMAS